MSETLSQLREKIDALDLQIQRLVDERARVAQSIGAVKQASGKTTHHPEREANILAAVRERNAGPLSDDVLVKLFNDLIVACRELQQ